MADPSSPEAIATHLCALGTDPELPETALRACVERFPEVAQPLRALLDRAASGRSLTEDEWQRFFRGLHVLAAARDTDSCASLLRLLRRSPDEVDDLLGDAVSVTLPRLLISLYDGDGEALLAVAADRSVDDYVRSAVLKAAIYLAWQTRLDVGRLRRFLVDFDDQRSAADGDFTWFVWMQAVALLDLRDLVPMVETAWKAGRIDRSIQDWSDFKTDLARARVAWDDESRFSFFAVGTVDDVVAELAWTRPAVDDDGEAAADAWDAPSSMPAVNPYRTVGRNDPCPCGSGRKAKKCCLASGS